MSDWWSGPRAIAWPRPCRLARGWCRRGRPVAMGRLRLARRSPTASGRAHGPEDPSGRARGRDRQAGPGGGQDGRGAQGGDRGPARRRSGRGDCPQGPAGGRADARPGARSGRRPGARSGPARRAGPIAGRDHRPVRGGAHRSRTAAGPGRAGGRGPRPPGNPDRPGGRRPPGRRGGAGSGLQRALGIGHRAARARRAPAPAGRRAQGPR